MHYISNTFAGLGNFFSTLQSAAAVANAVDLGARPAASDLRQLGIDPEVFFAIGHGPDTPQAGVDRNATTGPKIARGGMAALGAA